MDIEEVRKLATTLHDGQTDKIGEPYINHVLAVAHGLAPFGTELEMAGLLHDVIEDTDMTADGLRELGVPDQVVSVVEAVTRTAGEPYKTKILTISRNPWACLVKIADNAHNTRADRSSKLSHRQRSRMGNRYAKAREVLWAQARPEDVRTIVSRVNPDLLELL